MLTLLFPNILVVEFVLGMAKIQIHPRKKNNCDLLKLKRKKDW